MTAVMAPGPRFSLPWTALRRMRRDPLAFLTEVASHGPVAHFRIGPQDIFLLSDPAGIEDVLVTAAASFKKGRALERAKRTLGEGLLTSEGTFHLRQRRLMQPAFHRARVAGYAEAMIRAAVETRDRWRADVPMDVAVEMNRLTLAIVSDTLFGADVGRDSDTARVQQAVSEVMEMFDLVLVPFAEWLLRLPLPRTRRYLAAQATLDEVIYGIIASRRAAADDRGDLLSMLLHAQDGENAGSGMTDTQLRDEVITLFLAGHETTANALSWTWVMLGQHREVEERLQQELDDVLGGRTPTADDVVRLPYTRAVISETLRLYPPAWTLGRRALSDYRWAGVEIPAGSIVLMSQWVVHRDPRWWPEPARFNPSRWLSEVARPKFAYFPFGGGNRVCIGESFAWTEAVLLLAVLAQKWRVMVDPGRTIEPHPLITLRVSPGVPAHVQDRAPVSSHEERR